MVALFQAFLERQKQLALFKHFVAFSQNYFFLENVDLCSTLKKKTKSTKRNEKSNSNATLIRGLISSFFWAHFPNSGW